MTPMQKRAIEYVKNTAGGATLDHFMCDHEPIGKLVWNDIKQLDAVQINDLGKIELTETGKKLIS